jgi:putative membrane protein
MADLHAASSAARFEVRATAADHFAWVRTRLALERTMMAWQRTAVALIGFGFAIVRYFNHLQQIPGARPAYLPTAPEYLGLALISCGILALAISIWQYRWGIRYLWGRTVHANRRRYQGGKANAGYCRRHCSRLHWPVRLLCRVVPPHLAPRPSNETNEHFRNHPTNERRSRWLDPGSRQAEHRRHLGR